MSFMFRDRKETEFDYGISKGMSRVTCRFPLKLKDLKKWMNEEVYNYMCEFLKVDDLSKCDSISIEFDGYDESLIFRNSYMR